MPMKVLQQVRGQRDTWVRSAEHVVLRVVSFVFSIVSAHAIRWIFSPLDTATGADMLQPYITWAAAAGFGILGYFVSRGLTYRLMRKESFLSYVPICLVVELVEIFANYAQAADVIQHAAWIHFAPLNQQGVLVVATYIMLSIVPLASLFLAVVDMDLERNKDKTAGVQGSAWVAPLNGQRPQTPPPGGQRVQPGPGQAQPSGQRVQPGQTQGPRQYGAQPGPTQPAGGAQNPPGVRPQPAGAPV